MGVEKFFSSLKKDFTKDMQFISTANKKLKCSHFFIDFNSIVHVISQNMLRNLTFTSIETFELELIERVGEYIKNLISDYLTREILESIYILIDGVPTMAKIFEQKKRRYMGDLISFLTKDNNTNKFTWSKNNISPGTNFMKNMGIKLNSKEYYLEIKKICPKLKDYNVSGVDIMGEGEFKIIEIIKNNFHIDNIVVYSPDSDMILLLLLVHRKVKMLRHDQQKSTNDIQVYDIVDINKFSTVLMEYMKSIDINITNMDEKRIISDIVFILTIFGDDFLPKLETVRVNLDINIILELYVLSLSNSSKYLLDKNNKKYSINKNNFLLFLKNLQKQEYYFMLRNAKLHCILNYSYISKFILADTLYKIKDLATNYILKNNISPTNLVLFISILNKPEINTNNKNGFYNCLELIEKLIINNYIEILQNINKNTLELFIKKYNLPIFIILYTPRELVHLILYYFYIFNKLPFDIIPTIYTHKLHYNTYNSKDSFHQKRLNMHKEQDSTMYLIENKLDKYYSILNPKDPFYYSIYKMIEKNPGENISINYKDYYKLHFNVSENEIVSKYIEGLYWIVEYYHNRNVDNLWYYRFNRSPLLHTVIDFLEKHNSIKHNIIKYKNNNVKWMTPYEHYIFVTPFHLSTLDKSDILYKFVKKYSNIGDSQYFYDLDKIYVELNKTHNKLIDCSSSHFISKCHLLFMENYIDITKYLSDVRKFFAK
jgi:5'-3' exonuclease